MADGTVGDPFIFALGLSPGRYGPGASKLVAMAATRFPVPLWQGGAGGRPWCDSRVGAKGYGTPHAETRPGALATADTLEEVGYAKPEAYG
jgi:hypothetical protein